MYEHPPTQTLNAEPKPDKFAELRAKMKKFSWVPFVLILFLFFFPFIEVPSLDPTSFTGLQLAFGRTMPVEGELITFNKTVLLALLLAAAGIGLPFIKGKLGTLLPAIAGALGFLVMLIVKWKLENEIFLPGVFEYTFTFIAVCFLFLISAALHGFLFRYDRASA
jgi:hypothetical protein